MTGWKGNISPKSKTKLKFSSLESAIVFAKRKIMNTKFFKKTSKIKNQKLCRKL